MKKAIYPITDDICFKYLFRNKKILTDLLNSFYEYIHETKKVLDLRVSTNKEMIGSNRRRKVFYGDILVYLNTDEIASIEMYNRFGDREYKKSLAYLTRIYSDQFEEGEDYSKARRAISINFINGNYQPHNFFLVNTYGFVNEFNYGSMENGEIKMYTVRLDLVKYIVYNGNETRFERWLRFMKAGSLEEMEKIAEGDEVMEQALRYMEKFLNDEKIREQYDMANDALYYAKMDGIEQGIAQGIAQGIEQGVEQRNVEIAKKLLAKNSTLEEIMELTELSEKEIMKLKEDE